MQNADVLLTLGSRLSIRQTSYNWQSFARNAFKIQVDIDAAELRKPTVRPNLGIQSDLKSFLGELLRQCDAENYRGGNHASWLAWCRERVQRYERPEVTDLSQATPDLIVSIVIVEVGVGPVGRQTGDVCSERVPVPSAVDVEIGCIP